MQALTLHVAHHLASIAPPRGHSYVEAARYDNAET